MLEKYTNKDATVRGGLIYSDRVGQGRRGGSVVDGHHESLGVAGGRISNRDS